MASLSLGRQMLLWVGSSCRSSRCRLHEVCRECGCSRPLLRSGSLPRSFSSKTNAVQQSRAPSSYLNPLGMRHQLICAASVSHAARFCSSCIRSTSALALLCDTHAMPLTEARRRVFAEASVSQDACTSAFSGPSTSTSALSCCLTLSSALRGSCDTLSSSSYSPQRWRPANFCRSSLRPKKASAVPLAASGTSGLPHRCSAHEAAAPLQKALKHRLCSMFAVAGENLHEKCVFRWRTYVFDKRSAVNLRDTLQVGSHPRVIHESFSDSAQQKSFCLGASAIEVHSDTPATASRLGPYLPLSAIAMAPLSAGMTTTSTPTGRSTTAAARFSVLEIRSAGALGLYTTVTMKPNCPNGRGSAGWDTATQRLRCSDRKKQKELRGMASDTKKRFLFSVVHTGEAGSEHPVRCGASRGRRFRRPVLQTDSGETSPEGKRGGGDLGCSVETAGTKGTCISDFGGLKCIPVALGVAPLQQKEQSVSEKAESGSVEGRCEDFSSATPQNAETDSPLCTTAAEVPLSGGKLLSVHAPDEGSYAAVLQQKIRAESAGWVADSDLVNCLTDFLLLFKTVVDLPWAFALPLLGAAVRLTTLPFAISSERDIRLRAVYQEEMTALQRAAEKAKSNGFGSPEFKKAQKRLNTFLKKHNLSLIPLSIFQVLLVGLVVSLITPAIRNISGRSDEFPQFAVEHPAWVESLALPDSTPLTAFIGTYGMLSLIMAGWLVSDKIAKTLPQHRPSSTPFLTRLIPGIVASCVTVYAGVYFPVGAMFMLLPAAGVQAVFTRMFRMRAVERIFNLMPESVKPLHAVYAEALRFRAPEVFQMWQRELQKKNSTPRDVHSQVLLLWRKKWQQDSWSASRPTPYPVASNGARL